MKALLTHGEYGRKEWMKWALDPVAYGTLLAAELPKPIQNSREFDRMVARLEEMDFAKRKLTPEEDALRELLAVRDLSFEFAGVVCEYFPESDAVRIALAELIRADGTFDAEP